MRFIISLVAALTISLAVCAQQPASASLDYKVMDILARMKGDTLSVREQAFDDMMSLITRDQHQASLSGSAGAFANFFAHHPDQADRIKMALIELLDSSNNLFVAEQNAASENYTEEDSEHYAQLIDAVSSLDDERAIPALLGAITTGGMAQRGLLKYGDKALSPVMEQLKNPNGLVRATALGLSVKLLERRNDPTSHERAKDLIRLSLTDSDSVVRSNAVRALGCLSERKEFVPILEKIAKTDPQKLAGKARDGVDGNEFYPVRYDARQVLRDIQANKSCSP
ncbi:MAG TPA: HEAT repeat domain-containing protein [Candidatus Acidoferrum sp.]|nr:HEAT repeat domain-containing protein [Candidatus Acidoferrum sp.]